MPVYTNTNTNYTVKLGLAYNRCLNLLKHGEQTIEKDKRVWELLLLLISRVQIPNLVWLVTTFLRLKMYMSPTS